MFEALGLNAKEIRKRLNKDNGLVKNKLKEYGSRALFEVIESDKTMKDVMGGLLVLRDALLLQANNEPFELREVKGRILLKRKA